MERNQFTFYRSFFKAISRIKKKQDRADVYDMICAYALDQIEPDLNTASDAVAIAFELLRPVLDKAKAKAEIGKKGGSKPQANCKQNGSKAEANGKQWETASKKEKEGEIEVEVEKERENDSSIPPTPLSSTGFSPALQSALESWLRYKSEKHQSYKPEGLKALIGEIRNNAARYGEDAVIGLIGKCMSSNWQGIIWDRLKKAEAESGTWHYDPGSMEGSL
jgi:hypothetical protein